MAKKLTCIISGREVLISNSYFANKVKKSGSEDKLVETYICREAKKYLKIGNSIKKTRELLDAPENMPDLDEEFIHSLIFGSKSKSKFNKQPNTDFTSLSSITHSKTDPDVKKFIKKLRV